MAGDRNQTSSDFLSGIVEGFYGAPWSWDTRDYFGRHLSRWACNGYLYAPKADHWLRRQWMETAPIQHLDALVRLARSCAEAGITFGVGLSPFELYLDYGPARRRQLRRKIEQLNELPAGMLAILFDDMPGDLPELAARQAAIVDYVAGWTTAGRVLVCPTYYSTDPVLERVFGARPSNYWQELGAALDPAVDLFWTGPEVCSDVIDIAHLDEAASLLGRRPVLWDNYPVNDGARMSRYLHLRPLSRREPGLEEHLRGHLCNPMNQGRLSVLPLQGLVSLYSDRALELGQWSEQEYGAELSHLLDTHSGQLQDIGLDGMEENERDDLAVRFGAIDHPAALEVAAWLRGEYTFDPACLTD